jgi:hypothetical protein
MGKKHADADAALERTASEQDQTSSDSDQTSSDNDQTTSDTDQTDSDTDQLASDADQAASDGESAAAADQDNRDEATRARQLATNLRERQVPVAISLRHIASRHSG